MFVSVTISPISKRELHSLRRALGNEASNYEIFRNLDNCVIETVPPEGGAFRRGVGIMGQLGRALEQAGIDSDKIEMVVHKG